MALSVQRPAVSSPGSPSGISVKTFFEEQLSSSPVAFVPKNYEFSGDPTKKLGEGAEKCMNKVEPNFLSEFPFP